MTSPHPSSPKLGPQPIEASRNCDSLRDELQSFPKPSRADHGEREMNDNDGSLQVHLPGAHGQKQPPRQELRSSPERARPQQLLLQELRASPERARQQQSVVESNGQENHPSQYLQDKEQTKMRAATGNLMLSNHPAAQAKKRKAYTDLIFDSDDDDLALEIAPAAPRIQFEFGKKRTKNKAVKFTQGKPVQSDACVFDMPTNVQKVAILSTIDNPDDRNLQLLLWSIGCRYTLLSYQYLGVRGIAGVEANYPQLPAGHANLRHDGDWLQQTDWKQILRDTKFREKQKGILEADVMGLGKTVQAVVGCMLRNAIAGARGLPKLPTLLISPNDAVSRQWAETLIKAGVPIGRVFQFVPKNLKQKHSGAIYVLLNRYQLQTEAKYVFELVQQNSQSASTHSSSLFHNAPKPLLLDLKNLYLSEHGKARHRVKDKGESSAECVTGLLSHYSKRVKAAFRTVVIDEAHFLKNLLAYWGLGAGLLGLHAERVIPMTGTPYNNGAQDMATLMTFVDPSLDAACEKWWKDATKTRVAAEVAKSVSELTKNYMIRREKSVLGDKLPPKTVVSINVAPFPLELHVYEMYEQSFLLILEKFSLLMDNASPLAVQRKKDLFEDMIALAACMRMSLIHPVLPSCGRDFTISFSPSRRHKAASLKKPFRCVCCNLDVKREKKRRPRTDALENLGDDLLDDDLDLLEEEEEEVEFNLRAEKGGFAEIPVECCLLPSIRVGGLRHYAHKSCLEELEVSCLPCPLCSSLLGRANLDDGKTALLKMKEEAVSKGAVNPEKLSGKEVNLEIERPVYCRDVVEGLGGFKATAKIESIISNFKSAPPDDKVLILSFFKGSLDLLEAIFTYELHINVARFDGDQDADERQRELQRFKTDPSCRVLLLTVQSGGTGLNIVEANRCEFVDRWFNPFVHEQAEDRCHRHLQEKHVTVTYHDVSYTVDIAMRFINEVKLANASIVLADGSKLGAATSGMSYKEMAGLLGNSVRAVRSARIERVMESPENLFASLTKPMDPSIFDQHENGENAARTPKFRRTPFPTICDALASLLGYVAQEIQSTSSSGHVARVTPDISSDITPQRQDSSEEDTKPNLLFAIDGRQYSSSRMSDGNDDDRSDDDFIPGPSPFATQFLGVKSEMKSLN